MAGRIDEQLIRGEIDNRVRGRVTGELWFVGRPNPIRLHLEGDAWRDLAGRRLLFFNPDPRSSDTVEIGDLQTGPVGDITASRKVRVPDVSADDLQRRAWPRGTPVWHWSNSLYLEWYSAQNGRQVIESTSYRLEIDPDSTWDMTLAEEEAQRVANASARDRFFRQGSDEIEPAPGIQEDVAETLLLDDDTERPMSEAEAEKLQEESDRLTDRVQARMEAEGPEADLGRIIEEEIERARQERGEPDLTPEERAEQQRWIEELNAAAAEDSDTAAGESAESEEADEPDDHPLALRGRELALRVSLSLDTNHWVPDGASSQHPLIELQVGLMKAAAKLAGALDQRRWPPAREDCATTIVWLKRARRFLADARIATEKARVAGAVPTPWLEEVSAEARQIIDEISAVVAELRGRLERGFE